MDQTTVQHCKIKIKKDRHVVDMVVSENCNYLDDPFVVALVLQLEERQKRDHLEASR